MNDTQRTAYRILDASANRATEGIRTIEEFLRMGRDDQEQTLIAKSLRHDLTAALSHLNRVELLAARDTVGDVGTMVQTSGEYRRTSIPDVIAAAAGRVQQSLRVLEEYGKTIDVDFARQIESIRYRAYTWLRDVELVALADDRKTRLAAAQLYLLIDCGPSEERFVESLKVLAAAGVDMFQLRDKQANDRLIYRRASIGAAVCREVGALFLINDRVDIAVATNADGVHLGQDELPIAAARKIIGSNRLIGASTHDIRQVHDAIAGGADYIGCGPTFPSRTKSFSAHAGTEFLRQVHQETRQTPRPAFAIGGIDQSNIDQVIECGFHRIAVTAAINAAEDPVSAAKALRERLSGRSG